jgi:molybdopterin/thiamine biosynthesis adenylyltransferase
LKQATVLISRAGGIGGPAALAVTMAGVGHIIIAHGGNLESPDLNRQVLGAESGLGQARAAQFGQRLRSLNRFVTVEVIPREPDDTEALSLARRAHLVIACAPTFVERLRLNAAAVAARVPLIDAAQWGMTGTLMVLQPHRTACLRCIYPETPPFEEQFPVVGAISSAMGSLAALEAIKILSGCGDPPWGQLLTYDGFRGRCHHVQLRRDPLCCCCGQNPAG